MNHITDLRKESDSSCSNDSKNKLRQIVEDHKPLDNMPEALAFEDQYEICEYLGEVSIDMILAICVKFNLFGNSMVLTLNYRVAHL